jgi:hypothetical protein
MNLTIVFKELRFQLLSIVICGSQNKRPKDACMIAVYSRFFMTGFKIHPHIAIWWIVWKAHEIYGFR